MLWSRGAAAILAASWRYRYRGHDHGYGVTLLSCHYLKTKGLAASDRHLPRSPFAASVF